MMKVESNQLFLQTNRFSSLDSIFFHSGYQDNTTSVENEVSYTVEI